jgi:ABC-type lipoprotein export system ATPase subunit
LARALIANPKLILADEPIGNLNLQHREEIMQLFKKLSEEVCCNHLSGYTL